MLGTLALATFQISLVVLCSYGISEIANKLGTTINLPISLIFVFSSLHILPVMIFLVTGTPETWICSSLLIIGAISGLKFLGKTDLSRFFDICNNSRLTVISLIFVVMVRIATLPEDVDLVRGDIVSHIIPIIEWNDGKLGYPGVSYPRGFHALFLSLSFSQDYALVSNALFIFLMSAGWILFTSIVRGHLGDLESGLVVLLAGGAGIMGMPDGLIENSGWWLVRQSNLQPEISAWVFVLAIMWLVENQPIVEGLDSRVRHLFLGILTLGASVTNPFFFMVCAPFLFAWSLMSKQFSLARASPSSPSQIFLLFLPLAVLILSAVLMEITELRFLGTYVDTHDASHRHDLLVEELGVYYTNGLNFETISVLLTPKTELTIGDLSVGKLVKLVLLPSWFLIFAIFFSGFSKSESIYYSATVIVLYLIWYWGVPAPDGWSVIRTQYPHRSFAMILLVYLIREMRENNNLTILAGSLLWLSLEPEVYYQSIFRYEHSSRTIIACISFLIFYKIQELLPFVIFDKKSMSFWAPIALSFGLFGFWCSFNVPKFPNPDLGIMFFGSIFLMIGGILARRPAPTPLFILISALSICSGVLAGHIFDLSIGNYHQSSFILISFILAFVIYNVLRIENVSRILYKNSMIILFLLAIINSSLHIADPQYVTPLMIPG